MKIDHINFIGYGDEETLNISFPVGSKGKNFNSDVLVIQAYLNYISKGLGANSIGLGGDYNVPQVTGIIDADTYSAIVQFQITRKRELMFQTRFADARIDPGNYRGRKIHRVAHGLMSITLLHIIAGDASVIRGTGNYIQDMLKLYPILAYAYDQTVLGL